MKLNEYKNYKTCPVCGETLPASREYFKRSVVQGTERFHHICKRCEDIIKLEKEWKDGKLLCHKCGEFKDESCFTKNGPSVIRHYRRNECKECHNARQRILHLTMQDDLKLKKCLRFRFLGARDRAIKNNIPFNLELQYIIDLWYIQNGMCALSGLPMTFELNQGRVPTNVSIDKIDRTFGYIKGNIQLVCMACNQIKSDLTEIEMYNFCKNIVKNYENKNNINTDK